MGLPERLRQGRHARVEQGGVVEHLVVGVVLRRDAEDRGLDAQVDVLGDDDDGAFWPQFPQGQGGTEQVVVGVGPGQGLGEAGAQVLGLEEEPPCGGEYAPAGIRRLGG